MRRVLVPFLSLVSLLGFSQASLGPTEPEIVLPPLILQIEDLSVENVEAKLPPDTELLPPERNLPVLSEGEIPVGEPSVVPSAPPSDAAQENQSSQGITAEAALGAGLENTILGSLSVKTLGGAPRLSLSFSHLTIDGFNGRAAGSGFDSRSDDLSGALAFNLGPVESHIQGSYLDEEDGMQGQGSYRDRLTREASGTADFSIAALDWLSFAGSFNGGFDTLTLSQAAPLGMSELRLSPGLSAAVRIPYFHAGLTVDYTYRAAVFGPAGSQEIHRARPGLSLGLELPASLLLEGTVSWFWSSMGESFFPFEVSFSGTPLPFLTFKVSGGFRTVPHDISDLIVTYPLVLPQPLAIPSDSGWAGDAFLEFSLLQDLSISGKLAFMSSAGMLDSSGYPNLVLDTVNSTGLFVLTERQATRLTADFGLRWTAVPGVTLNASWKHEFLDKPAFVPVDDLEIQAIAVEQSGLFGGNFSVSLRNGTTPSFQLPVASIGGFFSISRSVRISLELDDVLQPALGGPRYGLYPFEEPGFRVIAEAGISF
jgi:hypothetical protein